MEENQKEPVDFFAHQAQVKQLLGDKEILLFLDYDGTLTPIVDTPDLAVISDEMREQVRQAAQQIKTSIVSGRATDDVRSKVRLENIFYAGSHGFEIVDPQGKVTINEEAQKIRPVIDEVYERLSQQLKKVPGSLVEHVKYTISVHYRLVAEKDFPAVQKAVADILTEYPVLRQTEGKKVFEVRPKIDWDKGRAVQWILKFLNFDPQKHLPVYIGDDTTDEDAFRFLANKGMGILVAQASRLSFAPYGVPDTPAVKRVLDFFMTGRKEA